jgi:hypothetical protein
MESFVKQLTANDRATVRLPISPTPTTPETPTRSTPSDPQSAPSRAASLPAVTRFRDPNLPYEDLIMCERDCMRCSYAATLDCDGNCGSCPRQSYCPCVNPAKVRAKNVKLPDVELPMVANLGRN